jgi:hypothetical protein
MDNHVKNSKYEDSQNYWIINRNVAKVIGLRGCCQTGLEIPCIKPWNERILSD